MIRALTGHIVLRSGPGLKHSLSLVSCVRVGGREGGREGGRGFGGWCGELWPVDTDHCAGTCPVAETQSIRDLCFNHRSTDLRAEQQRRGPITGTFESRSGSGDSVSVKTTRTGPLAHNVVLVSTFDQSTLTVSRPLLLLYLNVYL